jgi:hypothetical protein
MSDHDIKSLFEDCYKDAQEAWRPALKEMSNDLKFVAGDQWRGDEKAYLEKFGRSPYVFNNCLKSVLLLSGYERRNRTILQVGPPPGNVVTQPDAACKQHTGCLFYTLNRSGERGYQVLSDAFFYGSLVTGLNLVQFWPGYDNDIELARVPFNRALIDPRFTQLDLSDAGYIITGNLVTKEQAQKLAGQDKKRDLNKMFIKNTASGFYSFEKWPCVAKNYLPGGKDKYRWFEEFWVRKTIKKTVFVERQTGVQIDFDDITRQMNEEQKARILLYLQSNWQRFAKIEANVETVELHQFYNNELVETYIDPYGVGDYNAVLVGGYYFPEMGDMKHKLQGVVRVARDPQRAENRGIEQMISLIETQIMTGAKVKLDSLVNPASAYTTGTGGVIALKKDAQMADYERFTAQDIPAGLFNSQQMLNEKQNNLIGLNNETFGVSEKDIPTSLAQLRQGSALTMFQMQFDNFNFAKKNLGRKLVKMQQGVYDKSKVQRITGSPPAPNFYNPDYEKYDCTLREGILTNSQRQSAYYELQQLKQQGCPIPWSLIMKFHPSNYADELSQTVGQMEQMQQQIMMLKIQSEKGKLDAQSQMNQAKAVKSMADVGLVKAETAKTGVDTMLGVQELKDNDIQTKFERAMAVIDRMIKAEQTGNRQAKKKAITKK